MSDTDENDWIKIDMAETGKLQILKTNWNQAQTFSDAKSLCDSKGGKWWWDRKFSKISSNHVPYQTVFQNSTGNTLFELISIWVHV